MLTFVHPVEDASRCGPLVGERAFPISARGRGNLDVNGTTGHAHAVFNRGPCTAGFRRLKLKLKLKT
jgi:hypothetical protein